MKSIKLLLASALLVLMAIFFVVLAVFAELTNLSGWSGIARELVPVAIAIFVVAVLVLSAAIVAAWIERKNP